MMKRRGFLKRLFGVGAALAVAPAVLANQEDEYETLTLAGPFEKPITLTHSKRLKQWIKVQAPMDDRILWMPDSWVNHPNCRCVTLPFKGAAT